MIGLIRLCPKCGISPEPRLTVDNKTEIIRKDASESASITKMYH